MSQMIVRHKPSFKHTSFFIQALIFSLGLLTCLIPLKANAQEGGIIWEEPFNVSRSPNATSTDPFLLADPAGAVHLFWAEKVSEQPSQNPDTLMYSRWNGSNWTEPIDIYFAPEEHGNQIAQYPHATIDNQGVIHLVWLSQPNFPNYALFYSSVPASKATFAQAWKPATLIAGDLTGTNYSLDIKTDNQQNIHIVYSRVPGGINAPELRSVSHKKSSDRGTTWTDAVDIHKIPDSFSGASNNRLITDDQGGLFTTWSEWNQSGNGQAIYFSRSLDNGESWEIPIILTERLNMEYERDWNALALLEPGKLIAIWEGGWRAYRNVMYSYNAGESWTEPVDAFPGLIGENGFAEFARDSNDTLHMFFANRSREGNTLRTGEGLWHSVWTGDENWSEPILSSPNINMLNPKAVIMNGNQVMTTWYTGADREIMVMAGKVSDALSIEPIIWPTASAEAIATPSPTADPKDQSQVTPTVNQTTPEVDPEEAEDPESAGAGAGVGVGVIASILTILGIILSKKLLSHRG